MSNPGDEVKDNNQELKNPTDPGSPTQMPFKYKFREMKVHSSDEWMAGSTKKYRKVYDRFETTYLRLEISFFNKLFDEADWEATIQSKCLFATGSQRNELSNYEEKRTILKDENIVYVRHSWGNAIPGDYWRKGNYIWEGYIDGVKIGEATFYIEDIGVPGADGANLYFDVDSVKLYEGDGQASTLPDKKYIKKFSQKDTRFAWAEFNFKNKTDKDYMAEIFFLYSDGDGQPKGSQSYFLYVAANTVGQVYSAHAGWGNLTPGSWHNDMYTLEILFMDTLVATVPFEVGDAVEEGVATLYAGKGPLVVQAATSTATNTTDLETILTQSLEELNNLTGLDNIKTEVSEMVKLVKFYQETGKDVLNKFSLHTVFTGNPGTGKTTVARILAKIYKGLGILEKGHLVEVDREGLVAGYIGQTAIKTGDKIKEAMGGVLFIDEAYSLAQERGSPYDFGGEAIQIILKRMEDQRGKFGVIVAGYTQNMHGFINSNPGLKSRFDKYFHFEDYSPDQMFVIALSMFRSEGVLPDVGAATLLKAYFTILYKHRDEHFGNARTVRQAVAEAVKNQNLRLASMKKEDRTPEMLSTVILEDVKEFEFKETDMDEHRIGFKTGKE